MKDWFTQDIKQGSIIARRGGITPGKYLVKWDIKKEIMYVKTLDFTKTWEVSVGSSEVVDMVREKSSKPPSRTIRFDLPGGDEITVKISGQGNSIHLEPVSRNINRIHHHLYQTKYGKWNLLIRDQFGENQYAFEFDEEKSALISRELSESEKRYNQRLSD